MSVVNYRRHFVLLLAAAAGLYFVEDMIPGLYFAFVGLLHALAWVVALRTTSSLKRRLAFLIIATALSAGVPFTIVVFGMAMDLLNLRGNDVRLVSLYAAASASGAFAYWLVIRAFWIPLLPFLSLARSIGLCVVGTLGAFIVIMAANGRGPSNLFPDLPTYFWWLAFSSAMSYSEWRLANKPLQPAAEKRGG